MAEFLLPLITFAVVALVTPGPNNMMLTASGLNFGFRRSLPHILGICFGFPVMTLLVGWGLAGLFTTSASLHQGLKIVGAAYLVWLAWKIGSAPPTLSEGESRAQPLNFWQAAAFQWVNPKGWVMAVAAATNFTTLNGNNFREVAVIALIFFLFGFPSSAIWTGAGMVIRRWLSAPHHVRIFNIVMALALLASIVPMVGE